MIKTTVVLALFIIPYLILCIRTIAFIVKTPVLSKKGKVAHIAATILVPYLWAVIARGLLKTPKGSHEMPHKSEVSFKENGNVNTWTSLTHSPFR